MQLGIPLCQSWSSSYLSPAYLSSFHLSNPLDGLYKKSRVDGECNQDDLGSAVNSCFRVLGFILSLQLGTLPFSNLYDLYNLYLKPSAELCERTRVDEE